VAAAALGVESGFAAGLAAASAGGTLVNSLDDAFSLAALSFPPDVD
jgi:hypothetical protein